MRINFLKTWAVLLLGIVLSPMTTAFAGDVSLDPGYIIGQVRMGNADATFNTTSISTNASGGGYTSSKTTSSNSNYQLTVQGGDWNYNFTSSAAFTANASNNSSGTSTSGFSVTYNNRTLQVDPGQSVNNDYVNDGVIRFDLNITGDVSTRFATSTLYAQKNITTSERTYTTSSASNSSAAHRTAYWHVPVVPNQGIAVSGTLYVYCANGSQAFPINTTVTVNPGETVEIPLDVTFTCPPPPGGGGGGGGGTPCTTKPFGITGNVELPGVQASDFYRTTRSGSYVSFAATTNPYNYTNNYNVCADSLTGYAYPTTSFVKTGSNAEGTLRWPYLGGNSLNNRVTLLANQTVTKDYIGEAVPISGEIRFTGTVTNNDLYQYAVNFTGEPKVYKNNVWIQNLPANYGSLSFTRHKTSNGYKRPSQLSYFNYLSPGDWYTGQWTAQKLVTSPYSKQSDLNFTDYNNHYDGSTTYNFGTPIHIDSGVPKTKDFEYCMGSAIFRFRVVGGGLLSNPLVSGSGSHKNSSNKTDMVMSSVSGKATVTNYYAPEVEIFGPTGNYTLTTVRVYAQDSSLITFPAINVNLACNTTKIFDIPGPTLNVTSPAGGLITNALSIPVTGRSFSGSTIESVTVNGQATALTPITGGNNNEVAFSGNLTLTDGKNTVNVIATDVSGAQANDQIIVSVDRWLPTVIVNNDDLYPNTETSIPFTVQAADRGYGYTLEVYLDGALVSTTIGGANDTAPVPVSYSGALTAITLGTHTITAIATDLAGNSVTKSSTIQIYEASDNIPPVITLVGSPTVTIDAGTIYTDTGATATDDRDGDITNRILVSNPVNTQIPGSYTVRYNVSDSAGNAAAEVTRTVTVVAVIPPELNGLNNQMLEATSPDGAVASFDVTAISFCSTNPAPVSLGAPSLFPQSNSTITGGSTSKSFQWGAVATADGNPAQYLVQISNTLDFATVSYNSSWQSGTTWTQTLPTGTWYWRVIARDSVNTSLPATGNSFTIDNSTANTATFNILHHTVVTFSGVVNADVDSMIWAGPFLDNWSEEMDIDRSFLIFDTSPLGAEATVTSAKLFLDYQNRDYMEENAVTNIHESTWNFPGQHATFDNVGALLASYPIPVSQPFGKINVSIRPDYIKNTGMTKFALAGEEFWANADPGYLRAGSYLEVTYTTGTQVGLPAPTATPQENATSSGGNIGKTFQWNAITAADGDPVEYRIEISNAPNFSTVSYSSPWQAGAGWTQSLPTGTWYWRVTARDSIHTTIQSTPAASSFTITLLSPSTPTEPVVTCSATSGDMFSLGTSTVTCTATDACNRSSEGSFTIQVQDTTPPVLTLPADIIIDATSLAGTPVTFTATAIDTVDQAPAVTCLPASGSGFPLGVTTVTCSASDASGNTASGSFSVTAVDAIPPVLTVPPDMTVEATGLLTPVETGQATATDNLPVTITSDAPVTFPLGTTIVTWTATDENGNVATKQQKITVQDTIAPVVIPPVNMVVEATGAQTTVTVGIATATDAVGVVSLTNDAPTDFPLGNVTITWTAKDAAGNTGTALQTVIVVDTTAPTLNGLTNQVIEAVSSCSAPASFDVTAADTVDAAPVVTCSAVSGSSFALGTNTVTCTATDASGNRATGTFTITVQDTTAPVLTVPADKTAEATGALTPVEIGQAAATDSCPPVAITSNAPAAYQLGTTTVIWTATDANGNVTTKEQKVTIIDTTAPQISGDNQVIEATSPNGATATYTVTTSDNSGSAPTVTCSAASGNTFALGTNTVTCTATDASSNSTTGSFTITVQDTTPPNLTVPATITVVLNTSNSAPAITAFLNGAAAVDIVDLTPTITTSTMPLLNTVGTKTVTFTAVDDFGNTTVKTATINVVYGCGDTYLNNEETNFLTPVNLLKPFKLGSTIPVKLHLCDANNTDVTSAVARIYVQMYSNNEPVGDPIEVTSTSGADTGNYFRTVGNMYMYNLYTKSLASGSYQIQAVLDDGTTRSIPLFLKQ